MSVEKGADLRAVSEISQNWWGVTLAPEWLADAEAGNRVGLDVREGVVEVLLAEPEAADLTVELQSFGRTSRGAPLPPLARRMLGADLGERLAARYDSDEKRVVLKPVSVGR